MTNSTAGNFTDEQIVEHLNDEVTQTLLPVIVFICVVGVFSFVSNSVATYIFIFKMNKSIHYLMVSYLSAFCAMDSLMGLTTASVNMTNYYTFHSNVFCKIGLFLKYFFIWATIFTLMLIAFTRYLKICRPFSPQVTQQKASLMVAGIFGVATFISFPMLLLWSIVRVETTRPGVYGTTCMNDGTDRFNAVYSTFTTTLFVVCTVALPVMYARIGITARKLRRRIEELKAVEGLEHSKRRLIGKATMVGTAVTIAFVCSFLPFVGLRVAGAFLDTYFLHMEGGALVAYEFFLHIYFLHSAANPFIYGVLDARFRGRFVQLLNGKRTLAWQTTSVGSSKDWDNKTSRN